MGKLIEMIFKFLFGFIFIIVFFDFLRGFKELKKMKYKISKKNKPENTSETGNHSESKTKTYSNIEENLPEESSYSKEIKEFSEKLRVQFMDLFNSEYYGESAKRSSEQLFRIIDKFDRFKNILDSKLNRTEMTYDRFFKATEEVYHNILDNLETVKNIYDSVEEIDIDYITTRIESIKNASSMSKEMQDELSSLRQRKTMAKQEIEGVEKILSLNEQAMTDIDNMTIKLGNLNITTNRAQYDIDTNIAELKKMASRVNSYSSK